MLYICVNSTIDGLNKHMHTALLLFQLDTASHEVCPAFEDKEDEKVQLCGQIARSYAVSGTS